MEDMKLYSVYVPTNHVYIGDIFLIQECDIIRTNISVREGLGKPPPPPPPPPKFPSSSLLQSQSPPTHPHPLPAKQS